MINALLQVLCKGKGGAWNFLLFVIAEIRKIRRKNGRFAQILCQIGESSTKGNAMRTTLEKNL